MKRLIGAKAMNKEEFNRIVKVVGLNEYNISDSKESHEMANVIGITEDNGWVVFETDERATFHVLSKHETQEEAYNALFKALMDRKRAEKIMKKLRKLC